MLLAPSQRTLAEDASPAFDAGRKLGAVEMALCGKCSMRTPECPSRVVLDKVARVRHRLR